MVLYSHRSNRSPLFLKGLRWSIHIDPCAFCNMSTSFGPNYESMRPTLAISSPLLWPVWRLILTLMSMRSFRRRKFHLQRHLYKMWSWAITVLIALRTKIYLGNTRNQQREKLTPKPLPIASGSGAFIVIVGSPPISLLIISLNWPVPRIIHQASSNLCSSCFSCCSSSFRPCSFAKRQCCSAWCPHSLVTIPPVSINLYSLCLLILMTRPPFLMINLLILLPIFANLYIRGDGLQMRETTAAFFLLLVLLICLVSRRPPRARHHASYFLWLRRLHARNLLNPNTRFHLPTYKSIHFLLSSSRAKPTSSLLSISHPDSPLSSLALLHSVSYFCPFSLTPSVAKFDLFEALPGDKSFYLPTSTVPLDDIPTLLFNHRRLSSQKLSQFTLIYSYLATCLLIFFLRDFQFRCVLLRCPTFPMACNLASPHGKVLAYYLPLMAKFLVASHMAFLSLVLANRIRLFYQAYLWKIALSASLPLVVALSALNGSYNTIPILVPSLLLVHMPPLSWFTIFFFAYSLWSI